MYHSLLIHSSADGHLGCFHVLAIINSAAIEKGTLLHCWWECKLVQPLWRTVWRFLKKMEIELPYDPAIPLLGIHTEETRIERDTCTPMFIAALFIRECFFNFAWKQPSDPDSMYLNFPLQFTINSLSRYLLRAYCAQTLCKIQRQVLQKWTSAL